MSFIKALSLKFRELLTSNLLLIVLLVLPVLLGLTAGAANLKNTSPFSAPGCDRSGRD